MEKSKKRNGGKVQGCGGTGRRKERGVGMAANSRVQSNNVIHGQASSLGRRNKREWCYSSVARQNGWVNKKVPLQLNSLNGKEDGVGREKRDTAKKRKVKIMKELIGEKHVLRKTLGKTQTQTTIKLRKIREKSKEVQTRFVQDYQETNHASQ